MSTATRSIVSGSVVTKFANGIQNWGKATKVFRTLMADHRSIIRNDDRNQELRDKVFLRLGIMTVELSEDGTISKRTYVTKGDLNGDSCRAMWSTTRREVLGGSAGDDEKDIRVPREVRAAAAKYAAVCRKHAEGKALRRLSSKALADELSA